MCVYGRTIMCVNGCPCWRCPQGEWPNLSDQENGIFRGKHRSALDQREHDTQIKLLAGIILCVFVAQCVWMNRWRLLGDFKKNKKNMTFRELLNRPAGDARRQAPQVEGNGCGVNYLEWDWAFTGVGWGSGRGWGGPCVGGGVDAWDWCPVTSPMKLSLEDGASSSSRHSSLVLLSADRLLALLCSLTVSLLFLHSHPVAPHVSAQPQASTGSCLTATQTPFLILHSDGKTQLRLKLQCCFCESPI